MNILGRIRRFFKREPPIYHLHFDFPIGVSVKGEAMKPLDFHVPIEQRFGNRLMKVEH